MSRTVIGLRLAEHGIRVRYSYYTITSNNPCLTPILPSCNLDSPL
jgi:hypothetical protein